jgi:hypothetical protein
MAYKNFKAALWATLLVNAVAYGQIPIRPAYNFPIVTSGSSGPASVQVAETPFFFTPYIGVAAGRDDNVLLTNSNEISSPVYVVSPGLRLYTRDATNIFQVSYQGQIGRYTDSENDNYIDHTARVAWDGAISQRLFTHVGFDYIRGHDPRGSTDRPDSTHPDKYRLSGPNMTVAYGAPGAQGRVEAYYSDASRRYLNNREFTVFSDRDTQEFGGAFYWRVMPRTYFVFDARRTDQSYTEPSSPLSSTEYRYLAGVTWEATAATTGTVKIGRFQKRFESGLPEATETAWEALVTWTPRTYSRFDFYSARFPTESTGLGSYILSSATGAIWSHSWTSFMSTEVNLRYQKDEYQGFDRSDETKSIGFKVGYKFRRWLTLGAEYTHTQRDSNIREFEYDKNLYFLTATASM